MSASESQIPQDIFKDMGHFDPLNYLQHHYDQFCQLVLSSSKLDLGGPDEGEGVLSILADGDKGRRNTIEVCGNLRKGLQIMRIMEELHQE